MNSILISNLHMRSLKRKLIFYEFLDLVIKLTDGKIANELYCKSMESHQYLYYYSCHAEHIKRLVFLAKHFH